MSPVSLIGGIFLSQSIGQYDVPIITHLFKFSVASKVHTNRHLENIYCVVFRCIRPEQYYTDHPHQPQLPATLQLFANNLANINAPVISGTCVENSDLRVQSWHL